MLLILSCERKWTIQVKQFALVTSKDGKALLKTYKRVGGDQMGSDRSAVKTPCRKRYNATAVDIGGFLSFNG